MTLCSTAKGSWGRCMCARGARVGGCYNIVKPKITFDAVGGSV